MKLQVHAQTNIGQRKSNEDVFYVDESFGLFIVADGMGGHAGGEIASQIAVETVAQALQATTLGNPMEQLRLAVEKANLAVAQAAASNPSWQGMGTTLTILLLKQQHGYLAHIGDSRFYRLRNSQLEQLSVDHSLIAEQIRQGIITPEEAQTSTMRNVILQAIGITTELEICQKEFPLHNNDCFLLSSDGLSDKVSDTAIAETLSHANTAQISSDNLIKMALANGTKDNITAITIRVDQL